MPPEIIHWIGDAIILVFIPIMIKLITQVTELRMDVKWIMRGLKLSGDKAGFDLHSPHSPKFDRLIEQFWHGQLTDLEAIDLAQRLEMIIHENDLSPIEPGHPYSAIQKQAAVRMLESITTLHRVPPVTIKPMIKE